MATAISRLPSAFAVLESTLASNPPIQRVVVLLDFDGTLAPIVNDPATSKMPSDTEEELRGLTAEADLVGILTGRSLEKIQRFVGADKNLVFGASHGLDILGGSPAMKLRVAEHLLPALALARDALAQRIAGIPGAAVEDNTFSITVHWRCVQGSADAARVQDAVRQYMVDTPGCGLKLRPGNKVLELRPDVEWDKGRAFMHILEASGLNCAGTLAVYVGDDLTDEDVFERMTPIGTAATRPSPAEHGRKGVPPQPCGLQQGVRCLPIIVKGQDTTRESRATAALESPSEMGTLLRRLREVCRRAHATTRGELVGHE